MHWNSIYLGVNLKTYNKKEARMAVRGGGGHHIKKACNSHQVDE